MGAGLRVAGQDGLEKNLKPVNVNVYSGMSRNQIMDDLLSRSEQRAVILDANGNVVYVFDGHGGTRPGVTISEEALNVDGGEIIYSHVGSEAFGGTASPSAVGHLIDSNLKSMTVVANEGNYNFTKTRDNMSEAKAYISTIKSLMKRKNYGVTYKSTGKVVKNLGLYGKVYHEQVDSLKLNSNIKGSDLHSAARQKAVERMGEWWNNKLSNKGIRVTTTKK